jgi:hypothetical protein
MVTAGTLLTNSREALRIASFAEHEPVRSVQLYGVRPEQVPAQSPATRTPAFPEDAHARLGGQRVFRRRTYAARSSQLVRCAHTEAR